MNRTAFLFAVLMGASAATYTIGVKLASARINPALGAMIVTAGAFVVNLAVLLVMRARGAEVVVSGESVAWLLIAGLAAAGVDLFGLLAFSHGLEVTASFIVGGVHTSLILLVGFLVLREAFSWTKVLAVLLIAVGIVLLQRPSL
ncbi:MAG TPA: EamA family transporter [Methylomirabilota bacterium]|jgi:uncharacterized membrane protein|nr:EamA family transporter [Methylomirabilota bacterium]